VSPAEGIELDRLFTDKLSAKTRHRPQLEELLRFVRDGDIVIVHSMDRLARNVVDLRSIVDELTTKNIKVQFLTENLIFSNDSSPMSLLLLSMMGSFAEFERSLIRERQREGIALAQQRGAYKGRKRTLSDERIAELKERVGSGEKKAVLAREFGISRETLYQYLKR